MYNLIIIKSFKFFINIWNGRKGFVFGDFLVNAFKMLYKHTRKIIYSNY